MKRIACTSLSLTLLATTLPGQRDLAAGFSSESLYIDLDVATSNLLNLGVQHLGGEIFVSSRGSLDEVAPHFVTVFSSSGNKLRSWDQPGLAQSSPWGFRDGATDGSNLFFGFDFGIEIVDKDGNQLNGTSGPNLQTANGPQTIYRGLIAGNVLNPEQAGVVRALAYDRYGNGGDGSFWTGNFASSTFEIDTAGDILKTYPNAGQFSYGYGIDPVSRKNPTDPPTRLWVNGFASFTDLEGPMAEYDLVTGTLTGKTMGQIQGIQGGLDIVPASLTRGPTASGYDILHLQQGTPDELRVRRLHLDVAGEGIPPSPVTRLGTFEPDLLNTINDAELWPINDRGMMVYGTGSGCRSNQTTVSLDTWFDISRNPGDGQGVGGLNGTPAVIFANIGPDAAPDLNASSNLLNIRELAHLQPILTVPQPIFTVRSRGMVLSNDPLNPEQNLWRIEFPSVAPIQPVGECLRMQGLWIDQDVAFLPLALTNQMRFCRGPNPLLLCTTYAVTLGANSFNSDTSAGFFQVVNEETDPNLSIIRLTYSIAFDGSPSTASQSQIDTFFRWDTDSNNMADNFEGGDSQLPGCFGTYRNQSAVTTGLIFAGTPQQNWTPCDPAAMQGWVGSIDGPSAYGSERGDWLQLDFTFAPGSFLNGTKFEFDCDTDGGIGVNGGAMEGVIVEVEFKNGVISTGEFLQDPNVPFRAFAQL